MSTDTLHNEKELLNCIAEGDELAFTKLFEYYRNRIYSIAIKLTHSTTLAEEIVQDVFLKLWVKKFDLINIQNFSAYLFIVTRNEVYNVLKQISRNSSACLSDEQYQNVADNNPAKQVITKEFRFLLHKAVDQLSPQQKQVYQLIKDQGLKREEAADILKIRPETVKFHLAQAMKNIRAFCTLYVDLYIGLITCLSFLL